MSTPPFDDKNKTGFIMQPFFSILVAVYNTERYLNQCLDSILNQTFQDFELIIVDDASTDNSPAILNKYAKRDSRIRIINHSQNMGMVMARKTGIDAASANYIVFCDSDDELVPTFLHKAYEILQEQQYDIVRFSFRVHYEHSDSSGFYKKINRLPPGTLLHGSEIFYHLFITQKLFPMLWANVFRTELLKKTNHLRIRPCTMEDNFRITYLASKAQTLLYTTIPAYIYHYGRGVNGNSFYTKEKIRQIAADTFVIQAIEQFLKEKKFSDNYFARLKKMESSYFRKAFLAISKMSPEEQSQGLQILIDTWGMEEYAHARSLQLEYYQEVVNSLPWRMTWPIRRLYDFCKHDIPNFIRRLRKLDEIIPK